MHASLTCRKSFSCNISPFWLLSCLLRYYFCFWRLSQVTSQSKLSHNTYVALVSRDVSESYPTVETRPSRGLSETNDWEGKDCYGSNGGDQHSYAWSVWCIVVRGYRCVQEICEKSTIKPRDKWHFNGILIVMFAAWCVKASTGETVEVTGGEKAAVSPPPTVTNPDHFVPPSMIPQFLSPLPLLHHLLH